MRLAEEKIFLAAITSFLPVFNGVSDVKKKDSFLCTKKMSSDETLYSSMFQQMQCVNENAKRKTKR